MGNKKSSKAHRQRRNELQKVNAVSKASIKLLNPGYVMGIYDVSDDDSGRDYDREDGYGGCTSSESWGDDLTSSTTAPSSLQHTSPVPKVKVTPEETISSSSNQGHQAAYQENALGLLGVDISAMSRKGSSETVRPGKEKVITQTSSPHAAPSDYATQKTKDVVSPGTLSFSRFFSWKRNNNKLGKTSPPKQSEQAASQARNQQVPTSAPAHVTTFAAASKARVSSPKFIEAPSTASPSDQTRQQARFKAHLNDLYKSYAMDNRFIGEDMNLVQALPSPDQTSPLSMPLTPNYFTTPLHGMSSLSPQTKSGSEHKRGVPTLREVRKATPSTIGMQHQAMMAQRYYDSDASLASSSAATRSSPSSRPPYQRLHSTTSTSMSASSSSSSLSQGAPLRRVSSVGRGTRKGSLRDPPSFKLLPDFSFTGQPNATNFGRFASASSSSVSDSGADEDSPVRRREPPRRKRVQSSPRRPTVPEVPPLPSNADALPSGHPKPSVPIRKGSYDVPRERPKMRRRSKSFDSIVNSSKLRPAERLTPSSPLSPTLESVVDEADTFWPDFMTEEINLKRQQTQRNLAGLANQGKNSTMQASNFVKKGNEPSVAMHAQRVSLAKHSPVVGMSSPRMISLSPRMSIRGSANVSGKFRPISAASTATARPAANDQSTSPLLQAESSDTFDKRASSASTIRPASPATRSANDNERSALLDAPVVNVMPPTPDMSHEQTAFEKEEPNQGPVIVVEDENGSSTLTEHRGGQSFESSDEFEHCTNDDRVESNLVEAKEERPEAAAEFKAHHGRNASEASVPTTLDSVEPSSDDYEEYSFVRSLSSLSIASSSDESSGSSNGDVDEEIDDARVEEAQIVSIKSPAMSHRFSRAQVVSPSLTMASLPSGTSLALAMLGSPPRNNASPPRVDQTPGLSTASYSPPSSIVSSAQQTSREHASGSRPSMPSLDSCRSIDSAVTTSSSILDYGSEMVHSDTILERINQNAFASSAKSPKEDSVTVMGMGHSPASMQNILEYVNLAAPGGVLSEEDCDTPRLNQQGFNTYVTGRQLPQTRPLNVRKNVSKTSLVDVQDEAPRSAPMAITRSSPGPSLRSNLNPPSSKSPYPREEKTHSPNLELDLSKPLDLQRIQLDSMGADDDKPRRRGVGSKFQAATAKSRARSKSNVEQASTRRANGPMVAESASAPRDVYGNSAGQRTLMASAMEHNEPTAMGLGLDLGDENAMSGNAFLRNGSSNAFGIQTLPDAGYTPGKDRFSPALHSSSKALRNIALRSHNGQPYQYYSADSYCDNGIGFAM